ncbi:MAG: ABC transporter permease, partial [Candidatus Acidiferrales bacterium]
METLWQDLKYGARQLLRSPGFTAVAVLTLALGIGANTAIFSVVNAVLLRPLPFPEPDQLVLITENNLSRGWTSFAVSPANYLDWKQQTQTVKAMSSFRGAGFNVSGGTQPERAQAAYVNASFFSVLSVPPQLGRTFSEEEDRPGHDRVVVLGHGFWQSHFAGDPQIVGKTVQLSGESFEVIGVMPPGFRIPGQSQLWAPAAFTGEQIQQRGSHYLGVIARLKPEATLEQARAELLAVAGRLEEQYPETNTGWSVNVNSLYAQVVGSVERPLQVLLAAVGFVLLIACANVANLLLARAAGRQREIAIRTALGAGRLRLVRQLLTESFLLGLGGGALGLLLAYWGIDLLRTLNPGTIPRADGIEVDRWVLLFTMSVSLVTGVLFGLAPALACSGAGVGESLKEGGRTASPGRSQHRLRQGLVVVETALALVLLVGSALLLRSFAQLQGVDPGFRADHLLTARVVLPEVKYPTAPQQIQFFRQVLERLKTRPGVQAAAVATTPPLAGSDLLFSFRSEAQE